MIGRQYPNAAIKPPDMMVKIDTEIIRGKLRMPESRGETPSTD